MKADKFVEELATRGSQVKQSEGRNAGAPYEASDRG
jgi:hypothetical protein